MQGLIERAKELLADGTVAQVLGWRKGDMDTIRSRLISIRKKIYRILYTTRSAAQT